MTVSDATQMRGPMNGRIVKIALSIVTLAAALIILARNYDLSAVISDLHDLTPGTIAVISLALLANAIAAAFRFRAIAKDMGHKTSLRQAMAVVSASSLAGALFFQLAGQLAARGSMMARSGVPFANVVVITLYERAVAAILSALIALAGAYFIFGRVYLDQGAGGADFVKIMIGLLAAAVVAALLGYGRTAAKAILPYVTHSFVGSLVDILVLTILVQLPMMAAYIVASHALSPDIPIVDLIAASALVMFAASVPISLAGWGIREMSAVAALGFIGVSAHAAFTTAILIGFGSLASMGIVALLSLPAVAGQPRAEHRPSASIDYAKALAWAIPIAAAVLVLFQIYVPVGVGLLNVNLADPVVLIGASLFVLNAFKSGMPPQWRVAGVNKAVLLATATLTVSLLIGIGTFGFTTWAWMNRYLGWFVLLSYAATGALIVKDGGMPALRIILLSYAGSVLAVSGIEIFLSGVASAGVDFSRSVFVPNAVQGFSGNRNAFALQLLFAFGVLIVFTSGRLRTVLMSVATAALWFTGSRSGWIAAAALFGFALYLRTVTRREMLAFLAGAAAIAFAVPAMSLFHRSGTPWSLPAIVPDASSTGERITSILGGIRLFLDHPLFGAGLGAFRNKLIITLDGSPLIIHSTPLWLLAELGIAGFIAFAVPAASIFWSQWRLAGKDETSTLIALCFVAFAVMAGPADMLYQRNFWLIMGAALALPIERATVELKSWI